MNVVLADTEEFRKTKKQNKPAAPGAAGTAQTIETEEKRTLGLTIVRGKHIAHLSVESPPPADPSARLGKSTTGGISTTLTSGPGVARAAGRGSAPAVALAVRIKYEFSARNDDADSFRRVLLPVLVGCRLLALQVFPEAQLDFLVVAVSFPIPLDFFLKSMLTVEQLVLLDFQVHREDSLLPASQERRVASSLQVSLVRQAPSRLLDSTQLLEDNDGYTRIEVALMLFT